MNTAVARKRSHAHVARSERADQAIGKGRRWRRRGRHVRHDGGGGLRDRHEWRRRRGEAHGRLRALAMTSLKRAASAPDVPTVAETLPGYQSTLWYALLAPRATPQAIVRRVHADVVRIVKAPDMAQQLQSQGAEPVGNSPEELQKFIAAEIEQWTRLVKQAKIAVD